jgi:arylsulfatase A-like enzyme
MVDFWIGRLLAKLDALGLRENTLVFFTSTTASTSGSTTTSARPSGCTSPRPRSPEDSSVPDWLTESWLLTVERSPLYKELTNVPLMVRGPGSSRGGAPR